MEFESDIINCLKVLQGGGIILYPTDTIWGIGCDATNPAAVQKIFALKQRHSAKSMIILLADSRDINRYISRPQPYISEWLEKSNSPTTVIYDGALGLADNLIADDGTAAIRIIKEDFCRHLIKRFRKPIVSTSANISNHPPPRFFMDIESEIKNQVDYVVNYRQDDKEVGKPSIILRFDEKGEPVVLRS